MHRRETERIARALAERARRERARATARVPETDPPGVIGAGEAGAGAGAGAANRPSVTNGPNAAKWPARPVSAWSWAAVATIVIPVLLLVVAILA